MAVTSAIRMVILVAKVTDTYVDDIAALATTVVACSCLLSRFCGSVQNSYTGPPSRVDLN